ncbi:MAG: phosphoribosylformylglycinamidine cyclo-ligase [Acidobacteria bacterium]|nr:phosphoribosylformylglycinamidine cyclo-ligase [Acidobacteriota bacterium]
MTGSRHYTYAGAGVDTDAAAALVARLAPLARTTARAGTAGGLGGFGAVYDLAREGFRDPLLVAATDGVGTKLLLAEAVGRHDGIGIDLVAMSVNDLLVQGAQPLFFLDYFATGRLDPARAFQVLEGVVEGCRQADCALAGGETAELPGLYAGRTYDLAGFAVGAVERDRVLPRSDLEPGDCVLALESSGLHANGFSLVRAIVAGEGIDLAGAAPFAPDQALGDVLLRPTRIYARALRPVLAAGDVKALAHITGGGLAANLARVLPAGTQVTLDGAALRLPPLFDWLRVAGGLNADTLFGTFNCGAGMLLIATAGAAERIRQDLDDQGVRVWPVGTVTAGQGPAVVIENPEAAWRS